MKNGNEHQEPKPENEDEGVNNVIQEDNTEPLEPKQTTSTPLISYVNYSSNTPSSPPKHYGATNNTNDSINIRNVDLNSSVTGKILNHLTFNRNKNINLNDYL